MKDNMSKMEFKKQIAAVHMMLEDLQLYLNTHPTDRDVLAKRNAYAKQMRMLEEEYNRCYGMLSQDTSLSPYPWQWIDEPWPWEYEANYEL